MNNLSAALESISRNISRLGRTGVRQALLLWFALWNDKTPAWAKPIIISALAYLLLPLDAIPDFLPPGLVDDISAIGAAALQIAACITPEVEAAADRQAAEWFGPDQNQPIHRAPPR